MRQKGLGTWEMEKLEKEESEVKPSLFENHGSLKRNQVKGETHVSKPGKKVRSSL